MRNMMHSVLLRLKSAQLIASQILELCCSYDYDNNKQLLGEVFVVSWIIKVEVSVISRAEAEADNTHQDLDYSGYH